MAFIYFYIWHFPGRQAWDQSDWGGDHLSWADRSLLRENFTNICMHIHTAIAWGSHRRLCKHNGVNRPPLAPTNANAHTRTVKLLNPSTSLRLRHSLFKFIIPLFFLCQYSSFAPPPLPARFVPFQLSRWFFLCSICAFNITRQRLF